MKMSKLESLHKDAEHLKEVMAKALASFQHNEMQFKEVLTKIAEEEKKAKPKYYVGTLFTRKGYDNIYALTIINYQFAILNLNYSAHWKKKIEVTGSHCMMVRNGHVPHNERYVTESELKELISDSCKLHQLNVVEVYNPKDCSLIDTRDLEDYKRWIDSQDNSWA